MYVCMYVCMYVMYICNVMYVMYVCNVSNSMRAKYRVVAWLFAKHDTSPWFASCWCLDSLCFQRDVEGVHDLDELEHALRRTYTAS